MNGNLYFCYFYMKQMNEEIFHTRKTLVSGGKGKNEGKVINKISHR